MWRRSQHTLQGYKLLWTWKCSIPQKLEETFEMKWKWKWCTHYITFRYFIEEAYPKISLRETVDIINGYLLKISLLCAIGNCWKFPVSSKKTKIGWKSEEFHVKLHKLSSHCNFGEYLENQFILGSWNKRIQTKLLEIIDFLFGKVHRLGIVWSWPS